MNAVYPTRLIFFSSNPIRAYVSVEEPTRPSCTEAQKQGTISIPFSKNIHFVGREELLGRIEELLNDTRYSHRVALVGLGGIGYGQSTYLSCIYS
jgi:hypothetical protein